MKTYVPGIGLTISEDDPDYVAPIKAEPEQPAPISTHAVDPTAEAPTEVLPSPEVQPIVENSAEAPAP